MALNSNLTIDWNAVYTKAGDLGNPSVSLAKRLAMAFTSGTQANMADVIFADTRTIATTGTDLLDLVTGLTDQLGTAFSIAKLKGLLVCASPTNVNNVQVTRPATTGLPLFLAAGDGLSVLPGGYWAWASPQLASLPVSGTTGKIAIVNSGVGPVDYDIMIVGTSS